jgi:hypothetical protein
LELSGSGRRVARWFFKTKNPNVGIFLEALGMENVG